jgi:DNA-binding XRE family transcriptional regulator
MAPLRVIRSRALLTPRELAAKARVAPATVYAIEAGNHTPRMRVVRQLCEALGVHPDEVDEFRPIIEGQPPKPGKVAAAA